MMRVFVISLKGHERRKEISQCLEKLNIDFEFFDAVDGSNLSAEHKKLIDVNKTLKNIPSGLNNGEYACALSHALLYKLIVDEKIPHTLILEDDALATIDLKSAFDACVFENSDFDLMMLCYAKAWCRKWSFNPFFKDYQSVKLWNAPYRTTAYYINQKAAINLDKMATPISSTADWPIGAFKGIRTACLYPQLIVHPEPSSDQSTLDGDRGIKEAIYKANKKKRSFFSKYKRKILTTFFIPKRNNTILPHFWLKLLGTKVQGK